MNGRSRPLAQRPAQPEQYVGIGRDDVRPERLQAAEQRLGAVEQAELGPCLQPECPQYLADQLAVVWVRYHRLVDLGKAITEPTAELPMRTQAKGMEDAKLMPGVEDPEWPAGRAGGRDREQLAGLEPPVDDLPLRDRPQLVLRYHGQTRQIGCAIDTARIDTGVSKQLAIERDLGGCMPNEAPYRAVLEGLQHGTSAVGMGQRRARRERS